MNHINRAGRRAVVCMAAVALAGCFQSIATVKEGMAGLKGKPIGAAIARLGMPTEEATIAGVKTYTWRTSTVAEGNQYQCRIRVYMTDSVIGSFEGEGDAGSCQEYADRLKG